MVYDIISFIRKNKLMTFKKIIIKAGIVSFLITWGLHACEKQDMLVNSHIRDGVRYYYNGIPYCEMTTAWIIGLFIFFWIVFFLIITFFSDPTE